MKRRRSLLRGTAKYIYPPGTNGSPNVLSFPKVDTYYRITRSTNTFTSEGRTVSIHSWACEEDSTLGTHMTLHKTWREALEYANWCIRRARERSVAS